MKTKSNKNLFLALLAILTLIGGIFGTVTIVEASRVAEPAPFDFDCPPANAGFINGNMVAPVFTTSTSNILTPGQVIQPGTLVSILGSANGRTRVSAGWVPSYRVTSFGNPCNLPMNIVIGE